MRPLFLCLAVVALGVTGAIPAHAQKIRGRKTKTIDIRSQKVASGAKRDAKKTGPTTIDFEREKARQAALQRNEELQSDKRRKMIALVERVLRSRTYKLSRFRAQRSNYLMRKADLEFEEARYQNMRRYARYEDALEAYDNGKTKVKPKTPKPDYQRAIAAYRQLLTEDPSFRRGDEARFRLGYCLNQSGQSAAAAKVLAELVQRHPKSALTADAYLQMGEIWFDANKFIAAMGNYQMVYRKFARSLMAGYAEYKYAWCLHLQSKHALAIAALERVVKHRKARLKSQALRDIVTFWAELPGGWQKARDYLLRVGGKPLALRLMWRMARYYDGHDKNEPALQVLAWLLRSDPSSRLAPAYHQLQVDVLVRLRKPARLDAALQTIVNFYAPQSPWITANRSRPAVAASGRKLAEKALAYVATHYHREGKSANREDLLQRAAKTYAMFLARFPRSKQAVQLSFYLAELKRGFKAYDEAAKRYEFVVAAGPSDLREDAAFQQVFCLAQLLLSKGLDRPVPTRIGTDQIPRTPLQPLEKRFVAASDRFAKLFPKSKDTPAILFKAARIAYDHGQLTIAGRRFARVIQEHPKDKYAALAGAMALDSYSRLKDWPEVVKWARTLIQIRNFKHYKRGQLRAIIAAAGIKAAGILEKRGRFAEAALAMKAVYDEFPRDKNAVRALFNTAVLFEKARQTTRAMRTYEQVRRKAPRSTFAARATFVLGALYEGRADFKRAARYYGEMARKAAIDETPDALYNASVMHEALGEARLAEKIRRQYVKLYPDRKDVARVFFSIGKLLESQKKWAAAEKFYKAFVPSRYAKATPTLVIAAWTRAGRCVRKSKAGASKRGQQRALVHFRRAVSDFKRLRLQPGSLAAAYAGWAAFQLAEVLFDQFEAVKLRGQGSALVKDLIRKAKLREKAQKAYQLVLPYKALVWSTAAVYRIGMLFARTVEALYAIPVPRSITKPDEKERYKAMLQEKAQPVEEAALQAFRKAVAVAHRLRVYNRFTKRAAARLLKLDPDQFPNPGRPVLTGGYGALPAGARPVTDGGGR